MIRNINRYHFEYCDKAGKVRDITKENRKDADKFMGYLFDNNITDIRVWVESVEVKTSLRIRGYLGG